MIPARSAAAPQRRLSDVERAERKVSGDQLQQQIADLAVLLGWDWLHVGALRTKFGWKTPTRGTLSAWPDLTLVRARDRRLIFVEVKRELEAVRPDQAAVLAVLGSLRYPDDIVSVGLAIEVRAGQQLMEAYEARLPSIEVFVWRPSGLRDPIEESEIYRVLR